MQDKNTTENGDNTSKKEDPKWRARLVCQMAKSQNVFSLHLTWGKLSSFSFSSGRIYEKQFNKGWNYILKCSSVLGLVYVTANNFFWNTASWPCSTYLIIRVPRYCPIWGDLRCLLCFKKCAVIKLQIHTFAKMVSLDLVYLRVCQPLVSTSDDLKNSSNQALNL